MKSGGMLNEEELRLLRSVIELTKKELAGATVTIDYAPAGSEREHVLNEVLREIGVKFNIVENGKAKPMYRVRNVAFYGVPWNEELVSLVSVIVDSTKDHGEIRELAKELGEVKARIIVFVTNECPYCPHAVRAAALVAMSCGLPCEVWICDDFPEVANDYEIFSVPSTIIEAEDGGLPLLIPGYSPAQYIKLLLNGLLLVKEGYHKRGGEQSSG
ncbi:MAG: thioredoxin family protein [Thermofilaceae archaeon]